MLDNSHSSSRCLELSRDALLWELCLAHHPCCYHHNDSRRRFAVASLSLRYPFATTSLLHDHLPEPWHFIRLLRHSRCTAEELFMPSNKHVLSIGTYCFVMTLMAS